MSGDFFPVIVGIVVFFVVLLSLNKFVVERLYGWNNRGTPTYVALFVSAFVGFLTIWRML